MKIEHVFQKYLSKNYLQPDITRKGAGPVITISRETGCFAGMIADKLIARINDSKHLTDSKEKWTYITKEILDKVAEDLQISPDGISHIFEARKKSMLEGVAESVFSRHFVSDSMIIATIKYIIRSFAIEGNVVIVGRAGSVLTHGMKQSLHIKLFAPLEFREKRFSELHKVSIKEAKEIIRETDQKRSSFNRFFSSKIPENEYFDVMLNISSFDEDQVVEIIYNMALGKGLI